MTRRKHKRNPVRRHTRRRRNPVRSGDVFLIALGIAFGVVGLLGYQSYQAQKQLTA